jgi:hypothetical protein
VREHKHGDISRLNKMLKHKTKKGLLRFSFSRRCFKCGCELDVEDYFFNNICDSCGASQGYDKEYFENSDLNYCGVLK